jgi:hypothetical protein
MRAWLLRLRLSRELTEGVPGKGRGISAERLAGGGTAPAESRNGDKYPNLELSGHFAQRFVTVDAAELLPQSL